MIMSTHIASAYIAGGMPTGIFESGGEAASDFTNLIWKAAGAFAAFIFLRWLVQVKTFTAAIMAIGMGALLMFGVQIPQNGTADKSLNETVQNWFGGSTSKSNGDAPVRPKG